MQPRALLASAIAVTLVAGCVSSSHRIPHGELARLAQTPPEVRGARVRVVQQLRDHAGPPAETVGVHTQILLVPDLRVSTGVRAGGRGAPSRPPATEAGGVSARSSGGKAGDGKAEAIAFLVLAASALIVVAAIEGNRFDGWSTLHPMHPVHLFGHDGNYQVLPLAWIDPPTVAWTRRAYVRDTEGPWQPGERAPLSRQGWSYGMYGGLGSLESQFGEKALGPAFSVQLGYFPQQSLGILVSTFFGWRENQAAETLYESRYLLEVQGFPVQAGRLHAGLFGQAGLGYRWEDGVVGGNASTTAFGGGAILQLDINTRLALTARLGIARAHGEEMNDVQIGLAVF